MNTTQEQHPEPFDVPTFVCMGACYWAVLATALFLFGFMPLWGMGVTVVLLIAAGFNSAFWRSAKTEDCA